MKNILLILLAFVPAFCKLYGQTENDLSAIKLNLSPTLVYHENASLETDLLNRLCRKTIQLINQTGVAEIGYSTFVVLPKFDVVSTSVSQTGVASVFMAECEFMISIKRAAFGNSVGGATFTSFSKTLFGSGSGKTDAIINALSKLSSNDKDIVDFLNRSKQKIDAYFKMHCNDVMNEAAQASALEEYAKSIALYFSIPSTAPCFKRAFELSKGVYQKYVEEECNKKLLRLKSYVALAQTENMQGKSYYDSVMVVMKSLDDPASDKCHAEAKKEIQKIEDRLNSKQKEQWDLTKKVTLSAIDVEKEKYKAMGKISREYQQALPSTNVIIAH